MHSQKGEVVGGKPGSGGWGHGAPTRGTATPSGPCVWLPSLAPPACPTPPVGYYHHKDGQTSVQQHEGPAPTHNGISSCISSWHFQEASVSFLYVKNGGNNIKCDKHLTNSEAVILRAAGRK